MLGAKFSKFFSLLLFGTALAATSAMLGGCGPRKTEEPTKVAVKPAEDKLRTANNDTLYGHLQGDSWTISSPLIKTVTLSRSEIREFTFEGNQDSIRTKRGDILRGRLNTSRFSFDAKVGVSREFKRSELKYIRLNG